METILAIIIGIHSGILIMALVAFLKLPAGFFLPKPEAKPMAGIDVALAMAQLCTTVNQHAPNWQSIEIIREGHSATMNIKTGDGATLDPRKMN